MTVPTVQTKLDPWIERYRPWEIPDDEFKQILKLTLEDGDMRRVLLDKSPVKPWLYTYFICWEPDHANICYADVRRRKVLGWALLTERENKPRSQTFEVDVFVDPAHRGKKIGDLLISRIRSYIRQYKSTWVYKPVHIPLNAWPFDDFGHKFFDRNHVNTDHPSWDGGDVTNSQIKWHKFKMKCIYPLYVILQGLQKHIENLLFSIRKHTPRT